MLIATMDQPFRNFHDLVLPVLLQDQIIFSLDMEVGMEGL